MSQTSTVALIQSAEDAGERLAEPTQQIEKVFLDVGAELTNCARLLQDIITQFEALPNEFKSQDLTRATEQLVHVGGRSLEIMDEMGGAGVELAQLSAVLASAASPIDHLRRTVRMMSIVAINARIGAVSLAEKEHSFGDFAGEVTSLSGSMTAAVSKFFGTYCALNAAVSQVALAQSHFIASQREPLASSATSLKLTLDDVTIQRSTVLARSAETGERSREIVMKVGTTVMAMQSGDAVRQRLEHIQSALGSGILQGLESAQIQRLIELQKRQLIGAREMLSNEMDVVAYNIAQLVQDVDLLLEQSRSLQNGSDGASALETLRTVVEQNVQVLQRCEVERRKLDVTTADVASKVGSMLEDIASIELLEQKMLVVSLNAAVQCARLDQRGRALNVIAQQLRDLTKETLTVAGQAVSSLRRAAEISSSFSSSLARTNAASIGKLEDEALEALRLLSGFDERLNTVLQGLAQDVPQVKEKLNLVGSLLEASSAVASSFKRVEEDISVHQYVAQDNLEWPELYEKLRGAYTMDAERDIHDAFVGAT